MLATLDGDLVPETAVLALKTQHDLLGGLSLLVENGLSLTTVTLLLAVVTALSLGPAGGLASLVLGHLVEGVLLALAASAEGTAFLGDVHLQHSKGIGKKEATEQANQGV